ncbi:cob(I)yrinic acid a,c-diamide adenosyltransferase [Tumebacillus permanentifrigoris]|uniref:Cob(I)alamin adenosyltransferase n=1 Tax=Tumebacillus permanentifrigoris TaxID=378543 RepID=A0A316DB43_9BACL|nr:cob(I)yrinic acid a,c-diamide adenosyltransferase [Tumebacillus permanentifrigoris]PWK14825.1 cob(I)alamin adenosyltransferase [Tumebacillus permanentifrigoris]
MDRSKRRGMTLVYTGEGKGKTTAALGLCMRAVGRGYNVLVLQFIKGPQRTYGEKTTFATLGVDIRQLGIGFTWTKTPEEHRVALAKAWEIVQQEVRSGAYDVIVLDELNNALAITKFPIDDVLPLPEVLDLIRTRPSYTHLVITGRSAKQEIIDVADLVTEMQPIKHYYEEGIPAVFGVEF